MEKKIPSYLIESKAERRMRLSFQKENINLSTKVKPSKRIYNRKKLKLALIAF